MNTLTQQLAVRIRRLRRFCGWPGVAAWVITLVTAIAAATLLPPLDDAVTSLQQAVQDGRATATAVPASQPEEDPAARLAVFYAAFPAGNDATAVLESLFAAAARENLRIEHGDYQLGNAAPGPLQRYDMTLPIKGSYPGLRKFLAAALKQHPSLALEGVTLARGAVSESGVNASVRFSYYARAGQ